MFGYNLLPFYNAEDTGFGGNGTMDLFEALNQEDDVVEEKIEKPKVEKPKVDKDDEDEVVIKNEKDNEDDEEETEETDENEEALKEIEEELEEVDDEKLELTTPVRRAEILKKYPTIFKDFPYLERAYYREQAYTEIVPTIDDAKVAVEKARTLDAFEENLMTGDTERVLRAIKDTDANAFNKVADNYLETLAKVDEKAYYHVLGNVISHTINSMVKESKNSKNEALEAAAQILNQFAFGTSEPRQASKLSVDKPENSERDEIEKERESLRRERFIEIRDELSTKINNLLKSTIDSHIDPKGSMTDYVKKNATREVVEELQTSIHGDKRFKLILDKLWQNAARNNFKKEHVDKIRSAYLSKAKTLLPTVIKKARNEALKGMGKRVSDDPKEGPKDKGNPNPKPRVRNDNTPGRIPVGMKTIDYLMAD